MKIKHNIGKSIILFDNEQEIGELVYKIIDGEIVDNGIYIEKNYRGMGYCRLLIKHWMEIYNNKTIYICSTTKIINKIIIDLGFQQINEPIPYWGIMSNGKNFKYIP